MRNSQESFEPLFRRDGLLIERIVSHGQVTPQDEPYLQSHDEWVTLLSGSARVQIEGQPEHRLQPGDHLLIPGGVRHWVTFTAIDAPTVWLAVHMPG